MARKPSPLLWIVLLGAAASPAAAQTRPRLTEEATTAPAGSLQFETGFDWIANEPNPLTGEPRQRWDGPLLRFVYSPAANVEFDLEWVVAVGAAQDPDFGSVSDAGDVSLRAKLRLNEEKPGRPTWGVRMGVTLPETKSIKGLGPDALRFVAQLLATQRLGDAWSVHGNAGMYLQDLPRDESEQVDFFAWGLAVERHIATPWTVLVEAAGRSGPGEPEAHSRAEARLGVRFERGRCAFDAALRRGLTQADGDFGATLGVSFRLRQPAPAATP
jgi:hypothetical protein